MNKFSLLLAALCVSLNAQEAKPADTKAAAPAPEVKLSGGAKSEPKAYFAEVWVGKNIAECLNFQKNIQVLGQQVEELKRLQIFLDNALTTPEKEARGHDIAAKTAKLKGDNESMTKLYNGFSIERPYQFVATKAVIATPISNEEFAKISAAKDFKPDTIISTGEKKFQIRDTVSGQVEVETFGLALKRITDAKAQLQQLIDLQPKLTKDDDKKKVEKAIKEIQDDLSQSLEEFKKARGFDFNAEAITLPSEARLSIQITEEEKKAIEAKAPTAAEKK
ncbi:MAG: hypothetical protein RLZZ178_1565 [Verrucomicrobiota bacterium]|jgi:hypothetical protein